MFMAGILTIGSAVYLFVGVLTFARCAVHASVLPHPLPGLARNQRVGDVCF